MRHTLAIATASGGIIALAVGLGPAAVASPPRLTSVPCDAAALASAISGAAEGDILSLAAGCTYQVPALPAVTVNLVIAGHGATLDYTSRQYPGASILRVGAGVALDISRLNFTGGGGLFVYGGAIRNYGDLTIYGGMFEGNFIHSGYGGAIYNTGQLTVTGATFTGNAADYGYGGAIYNTGQLMVAGTTFRRNSTSFGSGGAIDNASAGQVTLQHDTLSGNRSDYEGGAISSDGTLAVSATAFAGNHAMAGGGIAVQAGTARLEDATLAGNSADFSGGAIYDEAMLTATATAITGNSAFIGGGIYSYGGQVTLQHDGLSGNSATVTGGGIYSHWLLMAIYTSVTSNVAGTHGAGGIANDGGTADLWRDQIRFNTPVDCSGVLGCSRMRA